MRARFHRTLGAVAVLLTLTAGCAAVPRTEPVPTTCPTGTGTPSSPQSATREQLDAGLWAGDTCDGNTTKPAG